MRGVCQATLYLLRPRLRPLLPPTPSTAEDFVVFHVYAFASFLFSSLITLALKQAISLSTFSLNSTSNFTNLVADFVRPSYYDLLVHVNLKALRVGTLVSGLGSIMGCGFLTMALVNLVHIKLWDLSCGGLYTLSTIGPLVTLVLLALVIYVFHLLIRGRHFSMEDLELAIEMWSAKRNLRR
ncbi:hypothetical protein LINPERPRIM_LOCUS27863 [Linum perenne]